MKMAFFISPPYMLPRMRTRRRLKLMPTYTELRVLSMSELARSAPQLITVNPGAKSSSSMGAGRTKSVWAKSACQLASATMRTGRR